MRVMVTGHDGYIGRCWCRCSGRRATRWSASTACSSRAARSAPRAPARPADPQGHPRRRRRPNSRASTPWCTSPRSPTTPSATSTPSAPTTSTGGPPRASAGWPRRPASPVPLLVVVLASTAPTATHCLDRVGRVPPGDPVRRVEGAVRAGPARPRRRRLLSPLPAQRHRLRRLAPAARRPRRQQPHRLRLHDRQGASSSATARRGGRSCTSRTSPGRSSRCMEAPRESCTTRRSTSARPRRTTGSATSPRWSRQVVPGLAGHVLRRGGHRPAQLPGQLRQAGRGVSAFETEVDGARRRSSELYEAYRAHGLTLEDLEGDRFMRIKRACRSCSTSGRLDADLRLDGGRDACDCRICGAERRPAVPRPRQDCRCPTASCAPERLGRPRAPLRPRGRLLPELQDRPDPRGRGQEILFPEDYPYFSSFSDHLLRPLRASTPGPRRRARPRAGQPGGRAGLERRLSAAQLRRGRRPGARASTRRPTRCAARTRRACRRSASSSAPSWRAPCCGAEGTARRT